MNARLSIVLLGAALIGSSIKAQGSQIPTPAVASQPEYSLKILGRQAEVTAGSVIRVEVVFTNISDHHLLVEQMTKKFDHGPTDSIGGQPEVDKAYPYGYDQQGNPTGTVTTTTVLNDTAADSPSANLIPTFGEEERWFQATMYLMWVPAADPYCNNRAACTIPVPQGQVGWSFAGDAINTLQPAVNQGVSYVQWVKNPNNCSGGNALLYQQGTAYPQWSAAINP